MQRAKNITTKIQGPNSCISYVTYTYLSLKSNIAMNKLMSGNLQMKKGPLKFRFRFIPG